MATVGSFWTIPGMTAVSSLASYQYYLVQLASTAGQVKLSTSATSKTVGVLLNDPGAGEAAEVAFVGIVKAAAETSVAIGDALTASSTGRVKTTTTDGNWVIGRALEASSAAGDIIRIMLPAVATFEFA